VRWPELQKEVMRGSATIQASVILVILMASAFLLVVAAPALGLWPLLILALSRPAEAVVARLRSHSRPMPGSRAPSS